MNVKFSSHYKLASSRRSVSWGCGAKNSKRKTRKNARTEKAPPPVFFLAVFRAAHQTNKTLASGLLSINLNIQPLQTTHLEFNHEPVKQLVVISFKRQSLYPGRRLTFLVQQGGIECVMATGHRTEV